MPTVLAELRDAGAAALVVTQIEVDGTGDGPDLDRYRTLLELTDLPLIASGGRRIGRRPASASRPLAAGSRHLDGVIVGRALYEGTVDVAAALSALGAS